MLAQRVPCTNHKYAFAIPWKPLHLSGLGSSTASAHSPSSGKAISSGKELEKRQNLHEIQLAIFKCTVPCHLVHSQCFSSNTHIKPQNIFITQEGKLSSWSHHFSHLLPLKPWQPQTVLYSLLWHFLILLSDLTAEFLTYYIQCISVKFQFNFLLPRAQCLAPVIPSPNSQT